MGRYDRKIRVADEASFIFSTKLTDDRQVSAWFPFPIHFHFFLSYYIWNGSVNDLFFPTPFFLSDRLRRILR